MRRLVLISPSPVAPLVPGARAIMQNVISVMPTIMGGISSRRLMT